MSKEARNTKKEAHLNNAKLDLLKTKNFKKTKESEKESRASEQIEAVKTN